MNELKFALDRKIREARSLQWAVLPSLSSISPVSIIFQEEGSLKSLRAPRKSTTGHKTPTLNRQSWGREFIAYMARTVERRRIGSK